MLSPGRIGVNHILSTLPCPLHGSSSLWTTCYAVSFFLNDSYGTQFSSIQRASGVAGERPPRSVVRTSLHVSPFVRSSLHEFFKLRFARRFGPQCWKRAEDWGISPKGWQATGHVWGQLRAEWARRQRTPIIVRPTFLDILRLVVEIAAVILFVGSMLLFQVGWRYHDTRPAGGLYFLQFNLPCLHAASKPFSRQPLCLGILRGMREDPNRRSSSFPSFPLPSHRQRVHQRDHALLRPPRLARDLMVTHPLDNHHPLGHLDVRLRGWPPLELVPGGHYLCRRAAVRLRGGRLVARLWVHFDQARAPPTAMVRPLLCAGPAYVLGRFPNVLGGTCVDVRFATRCPPFLLSSSQTTSPRIHLHARPWCAHGTHGMQAGTGQGGYLRAPSSCA